MVKTKIISEDFYTSVNFRKPLRVGVQDQYGNPLGSEVLIFTINGISYTKYTDQWGEAELNINLPLGEYRCDLYFQGFNAYESSSKTITVYVVEKYPVKITADNLTKNYDEAGQVKALFNVYDGSALSYYPVLFQINGRNYTRTTDDNGEASLNIRLPRGEYACKIISPMDEYFDYAEKTVIVKVLTSTHMDGTNITKMEDETAVYMCAVYDEIGRVDCDVRITVNGVTYVRHTEADGLAKLNIRLPAGEYDIIGEFLGDSFHTGSRVVNHISSKPYMQGISEYKNGRWIPSDNTGFMESRIQVKQWSPEAAEQLGGVVFWDDIAQKWHKDIPFTSYEITETDPRVKTAKFTTSEYFDLTDGQVWVHISSPYHENFGGRILKVDFNKDNGLYTYQCQDGRRNYMNKFKTVTNDQNANIYYVIKGLLMTPLLPGYPDVTTEQMDQLVNHKICSGLRPLEAYDIQNGVMKDNWYAQQADKGLSYDSVMEKIMNYGHNGGCPVDIYFSPEGVCQLEPLDINTWLKTGFKITHSDLISYKYGFDTTNILTGVNFQTTDTTPVINVDTGKTINEELQKLGFYFGANIGMIQPVTETVTTETTTSTGGGSSGVFVDMGKPHTFAVGCDNIDGGEQSLINSVVSALQSKGHSAYSLGVGPNVNQSHGMSGSSSGEINIFIVGGICAGTVQDYVDGLGSYYNYEGMIMMFANCTTDNWISCNALASKNQVRAHDDGFSTGIDTSITPHEMFQRHSDKIAYIAGQPNESFDSLVDKLVSGAFNCGGGGSSSGTTTTEKINVGETYRKAQEEVVKSGRDLLNFEIKLPLNHTMFKDLHTNMMLFTELPKDFKLGNLAELFKILPTYKINRGLGTEYQENRWYIEKQVIKCDSNGLFSTLTLNVLPSPYSPYTEKLRSYREAYIQAYEKSTENNNTSGGTATGGIAEVAKICEQYHYKLYGDTCSDYSCMQSTGYGECWAFADLVYTECKARNINVRILNGVTDESSNHRYCEVRVNGAWVTFPYRELVNPASSYDGGDNWYFDFPMSGTYVVEQFDSGQDATW